MTQQTNSQKLDALRRLHASTRHARPATPERGAAKPASSRTDFTTLPAWKEMQFGLATAAALGLDPPFFRPVSAARGTQLCINGQWVENFASYDYLSLNRGPEVAQAVAQAVADWGVSATASRLVGGNLAYHDALEDELADFLGTEAALTMVSGHGTNQAILRTLCGPGDLIAVDQLAHNSIYEGIRVSGAAHVTFPHNDADWLDRKLSEIREDYDRVLVVTEGLFSMDGDVPDLARFTAIRRRHDTWLMLDEAHSIGVLGKTGRGIREEQGIDPAEVDIVMGTLSKTFCSAGGFVAGSRALIETIGFKAPGFIYSVGLSAPHAAASLAALRALRADPGLPERLRGLGRHFRAQAQAAGLDCGPSEGYAIAPVMLGDSVRATWISNQLLAAGFNVLPIIAPAVQERHARLRFFLNVGHDAAVIDAVIAKTAELVALATQGGFEVSATAAAQRG
ncbi:aminotransferase class I/II-fold pyridoxal phosphate-dependent enzyme [Sinirhodobacter populi]|uniref:Aminotransferase class I/II-fold pyridoxal phosphate-dependent enzyme n=1 Tax=Paenirhodobacter populi TaxID=2306993 RepID=A0A443K2N4_9RHOB|nr:aminotransferase class I/II-fold pyridoxal phosphate-dependent enzyme [Sinirhodobacter populi]RWR27020.1 aminotransferase class I/II-fold pyridoxal phosphate-dependent enzyme [Sinirhodobacter populi]